MNNNSWVNNPKLKNIDQEKLKIIMGLAEQSGSKQQNELLPFLLAAANKSKSEGVTFSSDEIDVIIDVMKSGKSKEEIQRMDKIRSMMKLMKPS
jgi:hypothetical protein